MVISEARRNQILKKIALEKYVSIQDLSKEFGMTEMTIRRDLDYLEKRGLLKRARGGAVILDNKVGNESLFENRRNVKTLEKKMIGKAAAALVTPGDCIGIDIGTTAYEMSCCIKNIEDLSVITASVPVVNELMDYPNINLICTGGEVSSTDRSLIGHNAIRTINEYVLDKAFIGVAGVSLNLGFTLYSMNDTLVKRALIERAREVIILTDSSKFGVTRYAFFTSIESADTIITDEGISDEDVAALESKGIRVLIAKNDESTSSDSGMLEKQTNLE